MPPSHLSIGFVRRGFSPSGGAEAYLKRLACGVAELGHAATLYTDAEWPPDEWAFGRIVRLKARTATGFADQMRGLAPGVSGELLMSLERIWQCDVYRAGDGVHRAWLERRARIRGVRQKLSRLLNPKHAAVLTLEKALLAEGGAARVITNSQMVKDEIMRCYNFPAEKIEVVYNGVPAGEFRAGARDRSRARAALGLTSGEVAVLFAGSGWTRKGLPCAIDAVAAGGKNLRLLVAGRGDEKKFRSVGVQFLGAVADMPTLYGAADIFLLPTIYDPFSNACLEALAAGLPVITTRANGFAEIIEDGVHGSVMGDPADVAATRAALAYWSEASRREEARPRNLELAARFDASINVARILRILQETASAASR